jgi:hypothetical protein
MMQENNKSTPHLELLFEMNRLFLSFLQARARRGQDCLGLPAVIEPLLDAAPDAQLDRTASLPHALFAVNLNDPADRAADAPLLPMSAEATGLYCLQVSLLQSARHLCRHNAPLAQTFLGLNPGCLMRLRCLALIDITNLPESTRVVSAAFAGEPRLWAQMLSMGDAEDHRSLRLIALQPRASDILPEQRRARHIR